MKALKYIVLTPIVLLGLMLFNISYSDRNPNDITTTTKYDPTSFRQRHHSGSVMDGRILIAEWVVGFFVVAFVLGGGLGKVMLYLKEKQDDVGKHR